VGLGDNVFSWVSFQVPVTDSPVLLRHETLIDKPIPNCILNVTLFWRAGTTERGLSIPSDVTMERHYQPVEMSPSECNTLAAYVSSNSLNQNLFTAHRQSSFIKQVIPKAKHHLWRRLGDRDLNFTVLSALWLQGGKR